MPSMNTSMRTPSNTDNFWLLCGTTSGTETVKPVNTSELYLLKFLPEPNPDTGTPLIPSMTEIICCE